MLSHRLRELTNAGLVTWSVTEDRPSPVSDALTDAGRALFPALEAVPICMSHAPPPLLRCSAVFPLSRKVSIVEHKVDVRPRDARRYVPRIKLRRCASRPARRPCGG